ncbi:MAG: hypothetical protein EOP38_31085 [Rubrivivax sp.]|nr:MAG: hypothetical protein EOP38_31085 [Rubrivivax sp.]
MNSFDFVKGVISDTEGGPQLFNPPLPAGATFDANQWPLYPDATVPETTPPVVSNHAVVRRSFTLDVVYKLSGATTTSPPVSSTVVFDYGYFCDNNRLWIQLLARSRGLGFNSQCSLDRSGAVSYAEGGARVATDVTVGGVLRKSVKTQVAEHRSELNSGTMVTMLAGQNDILQAYADVKAGTLSRDAAIQQMRDRGRELAAIVNDITTTGARVVLATPTDLGTSPYARQMGDQSLLHDLTDSFEDGLILTGGVINDGRKIALVSWFNETVNIDKDIQDSSGSRYGFKNNSTPLCVSAVGALIRSPAGAEATAAVAPFFGGDELRYCTTLNVVSGGDISTYLWADEVNISPGAHARLSRLAFDKIDGDNPL